MSTKQQADESKQILKAREKLQAQIDEENKQVTPEAVEEALRQIHGRIQLKAPEREVLEWEDREFELFDGNRHPANSESKYVQLLREQVEDLVNNNTPLLSQIVSAPEHKPKSLLGRVKKSNSPE